MFFNWNWIEQKKAASNLIDRLRRLDLDRGQIEEDLEGYMNVIEKLIRTKLEKDGNSQDTISVDARTLMKRPERETKPQRNYVNEYEEFKRKKAEKMYTLRRKAKCDLKPPARSPMPPMPSMPSVQPMPPMPPRKWARMFVYNVKTREVKKNVDDPWPRDLQEYHTEMDEYRREQERREKEQRKESRREQERRARELLERERRTAGKGVAGERTPAERTAAGRTPGERTAGAGTPGKGFSGERTPNKGAGGDRIREQAETERRVRLKLEDERRIRDLEEDQERRQREQKARAEADRTDEDSYKGKRPDYSGLVTELNKLEAALEMLQDKCFGKVFTEQSHSPSSVMDWNLKVNCLT
ncbi:UNVERIFIED_CONTAM: hypothetical protein PYX00_002078 [Menopon gallinae]|uniref:Uncharacterized protein n=1 Tax=Menopon gallinae TaxID=328185 RepID=A0AAW2IGN0_9NEOP